MNLNKRRPALFLDRDGVINEDVNYLHDPDKLVLIEGSADVIATMNQHDIPVVIISNQAGIGRGLFAETDFLAVQARLEKLLAQSNARINASYHCPHHPTEGLGEFKISCSCRKPQPGMLLSAAAELKLDLKNSVFVGDKMSDLKAGRAAGCRTLLVRTGYGTATEKDLGQQALSELSDATFDSLKQALTDLIEYFKTVGGSGLNRQGTAS